MPHNQYVDYVLDLLSPFGNIKARKMFGGYGIYKDSIFFAIIIDNILYFKVGTNNQHRYESYGSKPFSYEGKSKKTVTMSYWELPMDILEDNTNLAQWVALAVHDAIKTKKPAKKKSNLIG